MTLNEFVTQLVPYFMGLIVIFSVWITKQLFELNRWRVRVDTRIETVPDRIDNLEDWKIQHVASLRPDKELREQLPVILNKLDLHSKELQDIRREQIRDRATVDTKLDIILGKFEAVESNCLVHKLLSRGKPDTLLQLIQDSSPTTEDI